MLIILLASLLLYIAMFYTVMTLAKIERRFWLPLAIVPPLIMSVGWVIWAVSWGWWGAGVILILLLFAGGLLWVIKRVMM